MISFFVPGTPITEGNISRGQHGNAYHRENRATKRLPKDRLDNWREAIVVAAIKAWRRPRRIMSGPVSLSVTFWLQRPKDHYIARDRTRPLKPSAVELRPTGRPDLSKLLRAVEDALTACCYENDSQVVEYGIMRKMYAGPGRDVGADVWVEGLGRRDE